MKFQIKGKLSNLYEEEIPKLNLKVGSNLWKKTCFEAFFFEEKSTSYTELNFNVLGEYAFLCFESYRVASRNPSSSYKCLDIQREHGKNTLKIRTVIELPQSKHLLLSPTALLMPQNAETLYFALVHGKRPDFHLRELIENKAFQLLT